jgi:hypothetical protein
MQAAVPGVGLKRAASGCPNCMLTCCVAGLGLGLGVGLGFGLGKGLAGGGLFVPDGPCRRALRLGGLAAGLAGLACKHSFNF